MGNPKQKWTAEEEEALRAGIAKHGPGKWKLILTDPQIRSVLRSRSNIDLKDKWRNMNAAVQGVRDKSRTQKPKPTQDAPATPMTTPVPIIHESPAQHVKDDSAKDLLDGKNGPRHSKVNFEAASVGKEQSGLDIGSTSSYIEQRIEEPQNFGKPLGATLERHVQQDYLEKDDSLYWLKDNPMETNTSNQKQKVSDSLEEAAKTAAFRVAEAETKSYAAAEAVKEAEKFSKLAEETDFILQFAKEIFDRYTHGEMVLVA